MILKRFVFCSYLLITVLGNLSAQALIDFKTTTTPQAQLSTQFTDYSTHQIPNLSTQLKQNNTSEITLQFGTQQFELSLQKNEVLTEDFKAFALSPNQTTTQVFIEVQTFEGHLKGQTDKTVKLTVADGFLYGFITGQSETYYIEPLSRFQPTSKNQVILYPASAVTITNTTCAVKEQQGLYNQLKFHPQLEGEQYSKGSFCKEVHLAMAHDYSMFQKYNEDIELLFAYTIGVLNNTQTNFDTPFNDNLKFKVTEQLVPICSSCDPWTSSTSPGVLLLDFLNWGNQQNLVNNFHIGQFWTNRDLDGATVGYAYIGATCSPFNYQVIQDFSTNANQMRMVVAHELGHNLNAQHNAVSNGNIMDPVVSLSSTWTPQSVAAINSYVSSLSCLQGCQATTCPPVTNLSVNQYMLAVWDNDPGNQFEVQILDKDSEAIVFQQIQQQNYLNLNTVIDLCMDYFLKVRKVCANQQSQSNSTFLQSSYDSKLSVVKTTSKNCDNGWYDIEMELTYSNGKTGNFIVEIDGDQFYFDYTQSPQTILINDLPANGTVDLLLKVYDAIAGPSNCEGVASIDAPDAYCNFQFVEHFDACQLPIGWKISNSIDSSVNWQFGGSNRTTTNYPAGTIDGTCMAYFDDDLAVNSTGILVLESPTINISNYENLLLEFNYDFHSFSGGLKPTPHDYNNSSFNVEAWDGNSWITVFTHPGPDNCLFNAFWSCPLPTVNVSLDPYKNAAFKVRFVYDDDGKWAGAVGLDNFRIIGSTTCGSYNQLLQSNTIQAADSECTDDTGWTHYWNSAYPETILLSINKNNDPAFNLIPGDVQTGVNMNDPVMVIPNTIPYVQHPDGFNVLSRFWNVAPLEQPASPVSVRFYFTQQELQLLMDQAGLDSPSSLTWFKFSTESGVDPNPAKGHLEAQPKDVITLQPVLGSLGNISYAEFEVESFSGGGVGGYSSNLPVELATFNGTAQEQTVLLEWSTHSEQNSDQFIVERSPNGEMFTAIGSVAAAGNSTTLKQYQLVDRFPLAGINYYRLRQVDLDGTAQYSKVISVQISKGKGISVLSANPGTGPLLLGIDWNRTELATVSIAGVDGRQLLQEKIPLTAGFNRVELTTDHLGAGSYFVTIEGNGYIDAVKVVKVQ